jgi:5-methylcytosine-specific restriction endonuclease McrA
MPRRPSVPCAGGCGKFLWLSPTSLPPGRSTCQPCRRANPQVTPRVYQPRPQRTGACLRCGGSFSTPYDRQRYCSSRCRWNDSKRSADIRRLRNGRPYRRLREQVLAEERSCWLCDQPIGTVPWPDPLSGTIDHVVPVSVDPSRILDRSNVRAAHLGCNSRRTDFQFGKRMLIEAEGVGGTPTFRPIDGRKTLALTFLSGSETPGDHAQAG